MKKLKYVNLAILVIIVTSTIMQVSAALLVSSNELMPNVDSTAPGVRNEMKLGVDSVKSRITQNDMHTNKDAFNSYSASDDATLLNPYTYGTGSINFKDDQYDHYKFYVGKNIYTTLEFRPPPGVKGLDFIIYNPDKNIRAEFFDLNTTIEENFKSIQGYIYITIDADYEEDEGTYYLKIKESEFFNDLGTGQDASDSYFPTNGSHIYRTPTFGTGTIDYSTDERDQYRISVNSGDVITVVFTPPQGSESIDLLIFDTDSSVLVNKNDVKTTIKEVVTASSDGYIYITIDADVPKDKGDYYLKMSTSADYDMNKKEEAWNSYSASINAIQLFSGDSGYGSISYAKDQYDQYKIAVDSGDQINIWVNPPMDSTTIDLRVIDTDMQTEITLIENIASFRKITVDASGDGFLYFIVDSDSSGDAGLYYLSVLSSAGNDMKSGGDADDNYWASDSATLLKTPITAKGKLTGSPDQYDQYKVAVESGDEISIFIKPPSGATLFDLLIYDFDKTKIREVSDFNTSKTIRVTASGDGFIYFVLDADSSSDYGEYFLSVCSSGENDMGKGEDASDNYYPDNNIETFPYGSAYISYIVDRIDQYKVPVIRGRELNIYFRPPKGSKSVDLTIYGPDMVVQKKYYDVKSEFVSRERVNQDGFVYVTVSAGDPADTGGYGLIVYTTNPVTKYAVIVGISDYESIGDLQLCDEDATDWYHHLNEPRQRFDEIQVYGDNHISNYPQYNGLATEYNVKRALRSIVAQADENDVIAFISAGHGDGNYQGSSYLCQWDQENGRNGEDGKFYDTELAAILDDSNADRLFVFLDHCLSGGFGPNLMAMPNSQNVYCTTTCTESGLGYDDFDHNNGMWDYYFLDHSWQSHFGSYNTAMEDVFEHAHDAYPHAGVNEPQEFDGNPNEDFFL